MTDAQQREAARQFFYKWKGKGKEDEHSHIYWLELLQDVMGVEDVTQRVKFEKKVTGAKGSVERIDVYIPETKVIIEQKSLGIALDKPQPGHDGKTPYEQAKGYDNYLPYEERARWIVLSNFEEIWIYDLNVRKPEPVKLHLADLQNKYHLLDFLTNKKTKKVTEEIELSKAAGELVGKIRDRFLTQYNDPLAKRTQKSLNILCVRLVFCFYAEDAGLFGAKDAFCAYLMQYQPKDMRTALLELFKVLDTPLDQRADLYLSDELAAFPYVNGGLFSDENIVVPKITQEIKDTLIESSRFDWSKISPTIFGAVFESTLNPETRRAGGMHYTSIENIHKVIDPLFLDELKAELKQIEQIAVPATQKKRLEAFQKKLSELVFLDPACGSGNFLTETYISLRRLENRVLMLKMAADRKMVTGQISFGFDEGSPIQVSIHQFYGIEINDFAVAVAQTALWIAESQMMKATEDIIHASMDFLPLKEYKGITEANALEIDWAKIVPIKKLSYIMGNPPFVGHKNVSPIQKEEMKRVFNGKQGRLDYVSAWYLIASKYIQNTTISCAFVSTNTIVQGVHIQSLWKRLTEEYKIHINFAYTTFKWSSEAKDKASVFCVIIGFSQVDKAKKLLFEVDLKTDETSLTTTDYISPYLKPSKDVIIESRNKPLCDVAKMVYGNIPRDGGFYTFSDEEKEEFLSKEPNAQKYMYKFLGSKEYINGTQRWILFLRDCPPEELKRMPLVKERIAKVRDFRLSSKAKEIHKFAETPTLFAQQTQPIGVDFIIVPIVSSSRRRYIPMGYVSGNVLVNNRVFLVPNADIYEFGILMSNVHNAWMRRVAVRLKDDYSYSKDLVYNNFIWPTPTNEQRKRIEITAGDILKVRKKFPNSKLSDLYDPDTMPPELWKVHQLNDKAVMQAYGMPIKETDEAACVAWLMKLYQEKVTESK